MTIAQQTKESQNTTEENDPNPSRENIPTANCYRLQVSGDPAFRLSAKSARKGKVKAVFLPEGWVYEKKEAAEEVAKRFTKGNRTVVAKPWNNPLVDDIWNGTKAKAGIAKKKISILINREKENEELKSIIENACRSDLDPLWLCSKKSGDELLAEGLLDESQAAIYDALKPSWDEAQEKIDNLDLREFDVQCEEEDIAEASLAKGEDSQEYGRFHVNKKGVYLSEGEKFICSPIWPIAHLRSHDGKDHAVLVRVYDGEISHELVIHKKILLKATEALKVFADVNQEVPFDPSRQRLFQEYLQQLSPRKKMRSVQKPGWHCEAYVFPNGEVIGDFPDDEGIYLTHNERPSGVGSRGTLEEWQENVLALCIGNSRPIFCIGMSLAALSMKIVDLEGGGSNLFGDSSSGKTTSLRVGTSTIGDPAELEKKWRATANAIEGTCIAHHDSILPIDELGQSNAKDAGEAAYMITSGKQKGRMTKEAELREQKTWRVLVISTGEVELAKHVLSGGKEIKAGQAARIADIPAEVQSGYGCFENIHDYKGGKEFSDELKNAYSKFYGTAGREFLKRMIHKGIENSRSYLVHAREDFVTNNSKGLCNQALRVATRFGHVLAALKYAKHLGIFGEVLSDYDISWSVQTMFNDWLRNRGGGDDLEQKQIVDHILGELERYRESKFCSYNLNEKEPLTRNEILGWRDGAKFYVTSTGMDVLCNEKGWSKQKVGSALQDAGVLITGSGGKASSSVRIPSSDKKRDRVWVIVHPEEGGDDE